MSAYEPPGAPYRSTTLATTAFVLALVTLLPFFGFLTGLAAFVLGLVALARIRRGEAAGHGRAVAAVVISVVLFLLQVLFLLFVLGVAILGASQETVDDGGVSTALVARGASLPW